MIVYGWAEKARNPIATGAACPECSEGQLWSSTLISIFHIYWIPFFPFRKRMACVCDNCGSQIEGSELSKYQQQGELPPLPRSGTPLHYFSGVMLVALVVALGGYSSMQHNAKVKQFAEHPKVEDIYVVKLTDPTRGEKGKKLPYGLLKVAAVDDMQMQLVPSAYAFSSTSFAREKIREGVLRQPGSFESDQSFAVPRTRAAAMFEVGEVLDVIRAE